MLNFKKHLALRFLNTELFTIMVPNLWGGCVDSMNTCKALVTGTQ